jgi:hypothetical protein
MLLRVVLFAYSRGIISSRAIARACEEQVTFIALSGDSRPHFTTIAQFVSTLGEQIAPIFAAVLAVCDRQGLIGSEMFAIDGVKMPSHASKHRSGTRADDESAKMATAEGVIQGYTGVATVDQTHQIIVDAQAHGTGAEQELPVPVVMVTAVLRTPDTLITADAGYHSEANLQALALAEVPGLIADGAMR